MSSAKKKVEELCSKCAKQSDCDYKPKDSAQLLIRCLDFVAKESREDEK